MTTLPFPRTSARGLAALPLAIATLLVATSCAATMPVAPPSGSAAATPAAASTGPVRLANTVVKGASTPVSGPADLIEVAAGGPLIDAKVALVGLDGTELRVHDVKGSYFTLNPEGLPRDFRMVVQGGTLGGVPFTGELRAEVRGYDGQAELPDVTWASTLVSRYLETHAGAGLAQAQAAVDAYLGIPAIGPVELTAAQDGYFDAEAFLAAAGAGADTNAFLASLLADVDAGNHRGFALDVPLEHGPVAGPTLDLAADAPVLLGGSTAEELALSVVKGLASAIGSEAGAEAIDGFYKLIGRDTKEAKTNQKLQAINTKLDDLRTDIGNVSNQVRLLSQTIDAYFVDAKYTAASARLADVVFLTVAIRNHIKDLKVAIDNEESVELTLGYFERDMKLLADKNPMLFWHTNLVGLGDEPGILRLMNKLVAAKNPRYFTQEAAEQQFKMWSYWDAMQSETLLYYLNYLNGLDPRATPDDVKRTVTKWLDSRKQQLALLRLVPAARRVDTLGVKGYNIPAVTTNLNFLPADMVIDRKFKVMWTKSIAGSASWSTIGNEASAASSRLAFLTQTPVAEWKLPKAVDYRNAHDDGGAFFSFTQAGMDPRLDWEGWTLMTSDREASSRPPVFLKPGVYATWESALAQNYIRRTKVLTQRCSAGGCYNVWTGTYNYESSPQADYMPSRTKWTARYVTRVPGGLKETAEDFDLCPADLDFGAWTNGLSFQMYRQLSPSEFDAYFNNG